MSQSERIIIVIGGYARRFGPLAAFGESHPRLEKRDHASEDRVDCVVAMRIPNGM